MLPKWHVLFGFIFSLIIYFFFNISLINFSLIFLSSFLIDVDHYIWYIQKKKDFSLRKAYKFLKNLKERKLTLMIFHTIEFLLVLLFISFYYSIFKYIFIGMIFHSVLDIIDLYSKNEIKLREFSLFKYLLTKDKSKYF
jgi:hypothetical protein